MIGVCPLTMLSLVLSVLSIIGAVALIVMAHRLRHESARAAAATQNAVRLTTSVVARAAPFLECELCGATLDPRVGVGLGLDPQGQLRVRCGDHLEGEA